MISLSVAEKCQDCPNFSPAVNSIETLAMEMNFPNSYILFFVKIWTFAIP